MRRTIRRMLSMISPYRLPFAIGQAAMLVAAAAGLAFPWAVRTLFDLLLQGTAPRALLGLLRRVFLGLAGFDALDGLLGLRVGGLIRAPEA